MDFAQEQITRIHDFKMNFDYMTFRLQTLNDKYPSGVIIPVIDKDVNNPAFERIINCLNECTYLKKVYIAFSGTQSDYENAHRQLYQLKLPHEIIWCNKPEVNEILDELKIKGLDVTHTRGKGKDLWLAVGIASLDLYAFAIHDADIISYDMTLPTRLLYTVVEPRLDFFFSKGYYARINPETRKMYGRVYRLFINPLLDALQKKIVYPSPFIQYLQSFRYPLSGEVAMYRDVALNLRMPGHWGLEIGMLAEIFRNISAKRVCEVDLGLFDHKHKEMSPDALLKTAGDAFITLLRTLTEMEGINVSESSLLSLRIIYRRYAQDKVRQYYADAICNSLDFDRHCEETYVETLSDVILNAGKQYLVDPTTSQLPDWLRTISAMPNARERLRKAAIER
jgi:glucosyl-3-phosphoglycerate synthase